MATSPLHVIILAAGKGTRMKSSLPKVLHPVAGVPMLRHVMEAVKGLDPASITLVLAPESSVIEQEAKQIFPVCHIAIQAEQKGTGHAVAAGTELLSDATGDVLVVYGDTPLMACETLQRICQQKQQKQATIALAGTHLADPSGYGRLIMHREGYVERIVECKDASAAEKQIPWCWGGMMAFSAAFLRQTLTRMTPSQATGEYYLTQLLELSSADGHDNIMVAMDATEAMGVNDRVQLAEAEAITQHRLRERAMRAGVTMIAPDTVFLAADTRFGQDVTIHPHVVFGLGVSVGSGTEIRSFSHLDQVRVGNHCRIGPYARLRPGTELEDEVHIGNFVELKKSTLARGAKVNHLSYVGDSVVGAEVNIGAGTITCNYDGLRKHQTIIKEGAFIGSNTALVAPVTIGKDALIGAGSVITESVPDGSLAITRSAQVIKTRRTKKEA